MGVDLPSGTVTFLFTDLESSTRLWEERRDAMSEALARHDALLREAIANKGGRVVKTLGDGCLAVFSTAGAGVAAAVAAQRALDAADWGALGGLRARMGLHTGEAIARDGDYFGPVLNRASRLASIAHGGQVVCSNATAELAREALGEDVTLVDLGEHQLRDIARRELVFQVNAAGLCHDFPPLRSAEALPGNLPVEVSSFVGRERDMARVANALEAARVATITGAGGVGKTRLAVRLASELQPQLREGAWLIELAPVRDRDGVELAFAWSFNLTARAGMTLIETLIDVLRTKELLLVVDNCEHVLDPAAALIDQIVRSCPKVRVLATSREGLALDAERVVPLPSLDSASVDADVQMAVQSDAVRLFVERAGAVDPDFELTEENVSAVTQVCRRLDGVPLAIELAAARVTSLTPHELAAALDHRFDVLAGGRRGAVKRQQTLRATIDWSYDLLDEPQQVLLSRLSVFTGGCTRDAAEEVCSGGPVDRRTVYDLLAGLVARSLVVADRGLLDTRYRLSETIREYAEERVTARVESSELRARHARYFARHVRDLSE
ncbi:MAG TPA: adenylate/guanylate cyclase domain-containing protein, partial [Acidimicrobiales bacterium]|nr:adenylate/guanylate cyclase domain-containing protein [Acidimicrobiales bacterium]